MNRSMTENAPQNRPKRSKMSLPWPTPVTAPRRTTISWFTIRTGMRSSSTQSRLSAVVLSGLAVGGDAAGIVVGHHDDEARPEHCEEGEEPRAHTPGASQCRGG